VSNIWAPEVDVPGDTSDPVFVFVGNNHKIFGLIPVVNLLISINDNALDVLTLGAFDAVVAPVAHTTGVTIIFSINI
jgi:hypothetical protein